MHRTLRWAAATTATGVVLVVAAHSAGAAAGASSPEPSCEVVRQQVDTAAARYDAAAAQAVAYAQSVVRHSERSGQPATAAERTEIGRLQVVASQRMLLLSATTLGSPRCFDPSDVELARQSAQQLAPRLTAG